MIFSVPSVKAKTPGTPLPGPGTPKGAFASVLGSSDARLDGPLFFSQGDLFSRPWLGRTGLLSEPYCLGGLPIWIELIVVEVRRRKLTWDREGF